MVNINNDDSVEVWELKEGTEDFNNIPVGYSDHTGFILFVSDGDKIWKNICIRLLY